MMAECSRLEKLRLKLQDYMQECRNLCNSSPCLETMNGLKFPPHIDGKVLDLLEGAKGLITALNCYHQKNFFLQNVHPDFVETVNICISYCFT